MLDKYNELKEFNEFFDNFGLFSDTKDSFARRFPFTDIAYDEDKNVYIDIAMAGYPKEFITIKYENCILTIEASSVQTESKDLKYIQKRISSDSINKKFTFAKMYRDADVSATMNNGILSIKVMPKDIKDEPKFVKIM